MTGLCSSTVEKTERLGYNERMTANDFTFPLDHPGHGRPHDYFGRKTIGDPLIAADLLRHYTQPTIAEYVDLDRLQAEPTHFFGPTQFLTGPKEVILDVPYVARFRDDAWKSEVLMILEHKSSPDLFVPLQLATQAMLSLYKRWTDAGRPPSRQKFKLPMPLMVLVYCGAEELDDETLCFQEIFEHVPESLKMFVPQFHLLVSNLRRFDYEYLPGRPETQATVETMKRSFDGTLAERLSGVLGRMEAIPLDDRIMELVGTIAWFGGCVADIVPARIVEAVTNVIKGQKGIKMTETVQKGIFSQGIERGKLEEKINKILKLLQIRHKQVPDAIAAKLNSRTDLIALESLFELAAQCNSIEEFTDAL